jgi:hypothetical protein
VAGRGRRAGAGRAGGGGAGSSARALRALRAPPADHGPAPLPSFPPPARPLIPDTAPINPAPPPPPPYPSQLTEADIIEKLEQLCNPTRSEGEWIRNFDMVEKRDGTIELKDMGKVRGGWRGGGVEG